MFWGGMLKLCEPTKEMHIKRDKDDCAGNVEK